LDAVVALASSAGPLAAEPWRPQPTPVPGRPVVAVAGGAAFTFSYTETTESLAAAGAEVATFDPLRDESLPEGTSALVMGGGFPEVYAADLSANERLRSDVARLAASDAPIVAECAGLLYLCDELDGAPMCAVVDAKARMNVGLALGDGDAEATTDSVGAAAGDVVAAKALHRTVDDPAYGKPPALRIGDRVEGFVTGNVHASYLHTHWAADPARATRLLEAAR